MKKIFILVFIILASCTTQKEVVKHKKDKKKPSKVTLIMDDGSKREYFIELNK